MLTRHAAGRVLRPARILAFASFVLVVALSPASVATQPVPGPVQAELNSVRISDREMRAFYQARRFRPLWIRGGTIGPEADTLLRLLETAELDDLDSGDYRTRSLVRAIDRAREGHPEELAETEILLSRRFVEYVRDMRRPPRETGTFYVDRELAPSAPTVRAVLERAAAAPSFGQYLERIGWMHPYYGQLRAAYAATGGSERVVRVRLPEGPLLREGSLDPRVPMLRARLGIEPEEGAFDREVANAVRAFQRSHGLPDDGRVGPRTLAALNGGVDRRRVLGLNLARARLLPVDLDRYILVDAAAARLWVYEDGRVRDTMRVVVGRVTDPTPVMAGLIRYAAVNPYWNIPPDLVPSRVAEGVLRDGPGFLRQRRFEVLSDWTSNARVLEASEVDWQAVLAGQRQLRVRQLPGPENAMGRMKFMFPNTLGVYLHDTPERDLLREAARQFSAGCVRVEDAPRLARWLFGRPIRVPQGGREQNVDLPTPVPVYITYFTAAPDGDGGIAYRTDVYNRDAEALGGGRRRASR
ncbi:L,D-transpeptidase family protein [Sphingosinicella sp. LHD-64]|uniref:L,D-transpeptidase family protein n=1 Tax=Sphingosinicella sp. LHD-64 TaxID=3072139 RepID=UPI00280E1337|nr:L,D-transpeptidase family protein [Sphingosinicella sp. LHD-64]MDQ8755589.1 L,D-transpeptidase family protein [Sphingosinicella sp. LHD-64]